MLGVAGDVAAPRSFDGVIIRAVADAAQLGFSVARSDGGSKPQCESIRWGAVAAKTCILYYPPLGAGYRLLLNAPIQVPKIGPDRTSCVQMYGHSRS